MSPTKLANDIPVTSDDVDVDVSSVFFSNSFQLDIYFESHQYKVHIQLKFLLIRPDVHIRKL